MLLKGDLQTVFDALYHLGVIDPVANQNWGKDQRKLSQQSPDLSKAVEVVNTCQGDMQELMKELQKFDYQTLECLAMEVAYEFADFRARGILH